MEKEKQQVEISELEKSVSHLKEMLAQAAQRERILVAFPELNPHPQATPLSKKFERNKYTNQHYCTNNNIHLSVFHSYR